MDHEWKTSNEILMYNRQQCFSINSMKGGIVGVGEYTPLVMGYTIDVP